jgi:uncharacterized membrane-anchored protein YitT (DUF2179 family)
MSAKKQVSDELKKILWTTLGLIILGLAINLFAWKFRLISGGLPGYALIINYLTGFPVGQSLLIINTIILLLSFVIAGKTAGLRGVYGYVAISIFIDYSKPLLHLTQQLPPNFIISTLLLALQGLIAPIGISLALANSYSFGSYSSIIPIIHKFKAISPPKFFLILDLVLTTITLIFFGPASAFFLLINSVVFFLSFRFFLPRFQRYFQI